MIFVNHFFILMYNYYGDDMFTNGYELVTGITNLFISLTALIILLKIDNKLWKCFYALIILDGLFGFVIHGIVISSSLKSILWYILSFLFTITINNLLAIFLNKSYKFILYSSLLIYLIFFIEMIFNIDFLLTFIIYALFCICIILYILFKNINTNLFYILGFASQVLGGIFLITKSKFYIFDKNGMYHLFMIFTLILFYFNIKKLSKQF